MQRRCLRQEATDPSAAAERARAGLPCVGSSLCGPASPSVASLHRVLSSQTNGEDAAPLFAGNGSLYMESHLPPAPSARFGAAAGPVLIVRRDPLPGRSTGSFRRRHSGRHPVAEVVAPEGAPGSPAAITTIALSEATCFDQGETHCMDSTADSTSSEARRAAAPPMRTANNGTCRACDESIIELAQIATTKVAGLVPPHRRPSGGSAPDVPVSLRRPLGTDIPAARMAISSPRQTFWRAAPRR